MTSVILITQTILIFVLIIFFGYCEAKLAGTGLIVTVITAIGIINWYNYIIIPVLMVVIEFGLRNYIVSKVVNLPFFVLCILLFYCSLNQGSSIKLRPYEKEIRKLLMKHDPSLLHKVDDMMARHRYHEKELYAELKDQYVNNDSDNYIRPSVSNHGSNDDIFDLPASDLEVVERAKLETRYAIRSKLGNFRTM